MLLLTKFSNGLIYPRQRWRQRQIITTEQLLQETVSITTRSYIAESIS